jgi:hypothetical protein
MAFLFILPLSGFRMSSFVPTWCTLSLCCCKPNVVLNYIWHSFSFSLWADFVWVGNLQHVHSTYRNIEMASHCFRESHPITTHKYGTATIFKYFSYRISSHSFETRSMIGYNAADTRPCFVFLLYGSTIRPLRGCSSLPFWLWWDNCLVGFLLFRTLKDVKIKH